MLARVLEPEVMDSLREALDYDAMDHREVNRRFVEDLLASANETGAPLADEALDLGTGTAQIPIELCQQAPEVRVVAVDLAPHMLNVARNNVEIAGLAGRILLDRIDAKGLPYENGRFPAVISNSIVHHIPEPAGALAEAWRVLAPGGLVFFRDLERPADDAEVTRLVATYAGEANDHQRQMFDDSLRAALSLAEVQALVAPLGCEPATVRLTSDRHWTWTCRKPAADG